jgi:hypothetical protein
VKAVVKKKKDVAPSAASASSAAKKKEPLVLHPSGDATQSSGGLLVE